MEAAMNDRMLLGGWLRRFLAEYITIERNLSINTQKSYRDTFAILLRFLARSTRKSVDRLLIHDITVERVLSFLDYVELERGCSVQTRNHRLTALRSFARYVASREPVCVEWASAIRSIGIKKTVSKPLSWLTKEEMEALLQTPDAQTFRGRTEYAMLLFLYNTGARVSEATKLHVCDLELDERSGRFATVTLHGKGSKFRQCPLWPRTRDVLSDLVQDKQSSDSVFVSQRQQPYTRFGVYRMVERCAAKTPCLSERRVSPHSIRHTCACHLLQAGVDLNTIRAWLGHEHLDTTNIYAEIDLKLKIRAMELCEVKVSNSTSWKRDKGLMEFLLNL